MTKPYFRLYRDLIRNAERPAHKRIIQMDETFRNDILHAVPFDGTDALISMPDVLPGMPDIPIKMPSFPVALIEWCEPDQGPQGVIFKGPSFEYPEGIYSPLSGGHLSGKQRERAMKCFRWLAYLLGSTINPDLMWMKKMYQK